MRATMRRRARLANVLAATTVAAALGTAGCAHAPPRFAPEARRTCLVLSAGGTRGIAHLGAIAAARESGIGVGCVMGTSAGALMGALYASAPQADTTARFGDVITRYQQATAREASERGLAAGLALGAVATLLTSGAAAPVTAAVGGFLLGSLSTPRAARARLVTVLREEVGGARIEALPVPFATLHHVPHGQGLELVVDRTGDLADAVGASVANPFVFEDVDVARAPALDAGSDRVAAVPVEDACRLFPDANLLVVNVSGTAAFYDDKMRCPMLEVPVQVDPLAEGQLAVDSPAFAEAVRRGHDAVAMALRGLGPAR